MHRHMEVGLDVADFCAFAADDAVEVLWRGFCEREFGVREMRMCTRTVMMSLRKVKISFVLVIASLVPATRILLMSSLLCNHKH